MRYATYIPKEVIRRRVKALGRLIRRHYRGRKLIIVCVLKGAFIFVADLMRAIGINEAEIEFFGVKSFDDETKKSSGEVIITQDLTRSIDGEDVLVVEDIADMGITLSFILENFLSRKPRSLRVCTLLDKPTRRVKRVRMHYVGFTIRDIFVLGYGLDEDQEYRGAEEILARRDELKQIGSRYWVGKHRLRKAKLATAQQAAAA